MDPEVAVENAFAHIREALELWKSGTSEYPWEMSSHMENGIQTLEEVRRFFLPKR